MSSEPDGCAALLCMPAALLCPSLASPPTVAFGKALSGVIFPPLLQRLSLCKADGSGRLCSALLPSAAVRHMSLRKGLCGLWLQVCNICTDALSIESRKKLLSVLRKIATIPLCKEVLYVLLQAMYCPQQCTVHLPVRHTHLRNDSVLIAQLQCCIIVILPEILTLRGHETDRMRSTSPGVCCGYII